MNSISTPALQIFVGQHAVTQKEIIQYLKSFFCKNKTVDTCISCEMIDKKQHSQIRFLSPDKTWYTLEYLEDSLHELSFQQHRCFLFSEICSSKRLLKLQKRH